MHFAKIRKICNLKKIRKAMACAMTFALVTTMTSAGVIASAADTTTATTGAATVSETAPSGTAPSGTAPSGTAPSGTAPSGTAPSGTAPSGMPPSGTAPSGMPGGGANTMTYDYSGTLSGSLTANATSVTSSDETYTTTTKDQNAALVENAGTLNITGGTFNKSGDDTDGDNCNFYGLNSILLAANKGSTAHISGSTLNATSEGSNGIFATDSAKVYASNDTITTSAGNSRGLDATYGGTILANFMKITTKGNHCAALATDRGGGYISVTNSTLSTAGSGSPLLYSTGDIEVDNVTGTATGSQIAGMEGLNKILIYNSSLTSTCSTASASDPIADGVIIYQSTSGDAETTTGSTATFEAENSTLTSAITSGAMFYCTNTTANIVLSDTVLNFDSSKANLMTIQGNNSNSWGTAGSNGANVTFTGIGETLSGNIDVDTISSLNMYLLQGSVYTGATSISTNSVNTKTATAPITMNMDSSAKWVVDGNSTVTNLNVESGASIVDESGNTVSIVVNGTKVVSGTSAYTVTVMGSYTNSVTTSSSNKLSTSYIDRTDFDSYYGVSTTFGTNGTATSTSAGSATTVAATSAEEVTTSTNSENEVSQSVQTGDNNRVILYEMLMAMGLLTIAATVKSVWKKSVKTKDSE